MLQDESAALWVDPRNAEGETTLTAGEEEWDRVTVGSVVEVGGVTELGDYTPKVSARELRVMGHTPLPPAPRLSREDLFTGAMLTERRMAQGVVTEMERRQGDVLLKLRSAIGVLVVEIHDDPPLQEAQWLGAEVRVEGVIAVICNARGEWVSTRIMAARKGLTMLDPAQADPFAGSKVRLGELTGFSVTPDWLRRHTEGTVTYCQGSTLFVQDGPVAVRVRMVPVKRFRPGSRVEVTGFLDYSRPVIGITTANVRQVGSGPAPEPVELSPTLLRQAYAPVATGKQAQPCDYEGMLVSVQGILNRIDHDRPLTGKWRLLLMADGEILSASLVPEKDSTRSAEGVMKSLRLGSMVRITGIAEVSFPGTGRERGLLNYCIPKSFRVSLRTANDVTVLKAGPWWTPVRFRLALAVALTVALGALIRVVELRRTVRRQALRIEESLRAHRDAELEHKAAREERFRLAADLHDGVQQYLAGASYRMEAALIHLGDVPECVREQVTAAQTALERTGTELRVCMLGLREVEEGPSEFSELVRHCLERNDQWPREIWHLKEEGEPFPLSRNVMGNLLLFVQEAVSNAFKHAEPSRVEVAIRYQGNTLELEVWDDGKGFKESSMVTRTGRGMGLETMRRRLRWFGGSARILSQLGEGTRVTGYLSRNAAQAWARALEPGEETLVADPPTPTRPLAAAAQDWCDPSI